MLRWDFELAEMVHLGAFWCNGVGWVRDGVEEGSVRARMVPPPIGAVVRIGDEEFGDLWVFRAKMGFFWDRRGLRAARRGRAPEVKQVQAGARVRRDSMLPVPI